LASCSGGGGGRGDPQPTRGSADRQPHPVHLPVPLRHHVTNAVPVTHPHPLTVRNPEPVLHALHHQVPVVHQERVPHTVHQPQHVPESQRVPQFRGAGGSHRGCQRRTLGVQRQRRARDAERVPRCAPARVCVCVCVTTTASCVLCWGVGVGVPLAAVAWRCMHVLCATQRVRACACVRVCVRACVSAGAGQCVSALRAGEAPTTSPGTGTRTARGVCMRARPAHAFVGDEAWEVRSRLPCFLTQTELYSTAAPVRAAVCTHVCPFALT
jgi:hypothetical protein